MRLLKEKRLLREWTKDDSTESIMKIQRHLETLMRTADNEIEKYVLKHILRYIGQNSDTISKESLIDLNKEIEKTLRKPTIHHIDSV